MVKLRIAPGPVGDDVPEWTNDGIEELPGFFNSTADIWDQKFGAEPDDPFYQAVALQIPLTDEPIDILDLGCGTGIQLEFAQGHPTPKLQQLIGHRTCLNSSV